MPVVGLVHSPNLSSNVQRMSLMQNGSLLSGCFSCRAVLQQRAHAIKSVQMPVRRRRSAACT